MNQPLNAALKIFEALARANPDLVDEDELILELRQGGFRVHAYTREERAISLDGLAEACAAAGVPFCVCDGMEQSVVFYDSTHPAWSGH